MSVRLTPGAAADRIDGIVADANGNSQVRVAVTAIAENDRANHAMIKYLAKQWRIPKSALSLQLGPRARNKTVSITGNADDRFTNLLAWARNLQKE